MQTPEQLTKHPATRLLAGLAIAGAFAIIAANSGGVSGASEVKWLNQLAVTGNDSAQMQLGLAYREGRYGLKQDANMGLYWLRKAAKSGNAYAADLVADSDVHDPREGLKQALPLWQQAARHGNADAQLHLGEYLMHKGHDDQAVQWLCDAADRGNAQARGDLATLYRDDAIPDSDLHRGENPIEALGVRVGSSGLKTLFAVWQTLKASSPVTQSSDALIARAEQGDPVAEYQLGIHYEDGAWAVERNPKKAITWLKRSAEAGNRIAVKTLAEIQQSDRNSLGSMPGSRT